MRLLAVGCDVLVAHPQLFRKVCVFLGGTSATPERLIVSRRRVASRTAPLGIVGAASTPARCSSCLRGPRAFCGLGMRAQCNLGVA